MAGVNDRLAEPNLVAVPLDSSSVEIAVQIHALFQAAYAVEARLIGVQDFPPLKRTVDQIRESPFRFLGFRTDFELGAAVEYGLEGERLSIHSLVVDPRLFRRGLGRRLMDHLLDQLAWKTAEVETGAANQPAIALYERLGFVASHRWLATEGIDKVRLIARKSQGSVR